MYSFQTIFPGKDTIQFIIVRLFLPDPDVVQYFRILYQIIVITDIEDISQCFSGK